MARVGQDDRVGEAPGLCHETGPASAGTEIPLDAIELEREVLDRSAPEAVSSRLSAEGHTGYGLFLL
jgi:hypothetical protein